MKTILVSATALAVCLSATNGYSQQSAPKKTEKIKREETIVIRDDKHSNTTIEIQDGEVYVNGEKVANTHEGNLRKKIVIDNGNEPMEPPALPTIPQFFDNVQR